MRAVGRLRKTYRQPNTITYEHDPPPLLRDPIFLSAQYLSFHRVTETAEAL